MGFNSGFKGLRCVYVQFFWMWVPVTTAWRVLGLRMEEWPPIWRVAVNKLNADSRRGVVLQLGGLDEVLTTPLRKKTHVKNYP